MTWIEKNKKGGGWIVWSRYVPDPQPIIEQQYVTVRLADIYSDNFMDAIAEKLNIEVREPA